MPPATLAAARKAAGDKAQPALELVGFDAELSAAMKYAFGGSFVCKVRAPFAAGLPPLLCRAPGHSWRSWGFSFLRGAGR